MSRPEADKTEDDRPENLMYLPNRAALAVLAQMYGFYDYEAQPSSEALDYAA